jgi:electron transfer flavoprotein alpha/beta subunit
MKIAALIKQTPQLSEVTVAPGDIKYPDSALIVNPFDEYAVEEAIRIKEKTNGTAVAITFGKPSAESALRDVLALGIDEAYLIESNDFQAIDPLTNAKVLAAAIKKIGGIQLVLTGKQANDDDSSVVTSAVAAHLDWPQIGFVKKFDSMDESKVVAWRTADNGYDIVESPLPVVCSVVKEINEPRLPSLKGKMKAKKAEIKKMTLAELGINSNSPVAIKSIESPKPRLAGEIITGEADEAVTKLIDKLRADQLT